LDNYFEIKLKFAKDYNISFSELERLPYFEYQILLEKLNKEIEEKNKRIVKEKDGMVVIGNSGSVSMSDETLKKIATSNAAFVSRGDKSGTHAAELRFWNQAGLASQKGSGYKECGCGMGPALNIGASTGAYVLTDRGTWLNFKNRADLKVLVEGDAKLFNQYGVMVVNPAKHPHVKQADAQKFVDWVISANGQASIAAYKIGGESVFFPNANK
jgi:ABC-type tungstate transport system permease subunit